MSCPGVRPCLHRDTHRYGEGRIDNRLFGPVPRWWLAALLIAVVVAGCAGATPPPQLVPATATIAGTATAVGATATPTAPPTEVGTTAPSVAASATPPADIAPREAGSDAFDRFLEDAYAAQLRRDPELVTEYGLADQLGMDNSQLTNLSDAYRLETYALLATQLSELRAFDRAALAPDQALSYDLFAWLLADALAGQPYRFYQHPVKQVLGVHIQLLELMTDRHPMRSVDDAEDYIARLEQFPTKVEHLLGWLALQRTEGIVMPQFGIRNVIWQLDQFVKLPPERTELYTVFVRKLGAIDGIDDATGQMLLARARDAIAEAAQPAYSELQDALRALEPAAPQEWGLSRLPGGEAAYAYALRHHTTTELTAEEIHRLGLAEVDRIQAELALAFDALGIPEGDLRSRIGQVAQRGGSVPASDVLDAYASMIAEAEARLDPLLAAMPEASVRMRAMDLAGPAYYVPPSMDGSRPGTFYVGVGGAGWRFAMPTLAYHEAVPGHHTQLALAQELTALPTFRRTTVHTAYAEGWALYAERLAWEAGWYDDDPYGNIGRLQAELFRAARLVLDTGIHAQGWTREEAIDAMMREVGHGRGQAQSEIERYILWPGQATAYKVGMLEMLALRERAERELGGDFDLRDFHGAILLHGSLPLPVLDQVVRQSLQMK